MQSCWCKNLIICKQNVAILAGQFLGGTILARKNVAIYTYFLAKIVVDGLLCSITNYCLLSLKRLSKFI
jgi:hypothetical protein